MRKCRYSVDICETLIRTITVKAASEEEAREIAQAEWYEGEHVLDNNDCAEVSIIVKGRQRERGLER